MNYNYHSPQKEPGEKIRQLRQKMGLSQETLASMVGASKEAICCYELGERIPRDEIKIKLCDFFGVTLSSIFE